MATTRKFSELWLSTDREGVYIPDIRIYNLHVNAIIKLIQTRFPEGNHVIPSLEGSVDDLLSSFCKHCGEELIRIQQTKDKYFYGATIYCPNSYEKIEHPKEYWVEVWSRAVKAQEDNHLDNQSHEALVA